MAGECEAAPPRALLLLESLALEPERPRVLGDGAHDILGRTLRNLRIDLERHLDVRADEAD